MQTIKCLLHTVPTVIQQREEFERPLQTLWQVSIPLLFISMTQNGSFEPMSWKQTHFYTFLHKHRAYNIVKSYDNVIEKFKLTWKVTKVESDNATPMDKAFQAYCNSCGLLCYHLSFH